MDLNDTPEQAEFRARARAWLEEHRDEAPPRHGSHEDTAYIDSRRAWQRRLAEAGLAGVTWPAEFGGQGLGPIEQVTANQEISRAGVPGILDVIGVGMLGPCLIAHGSDEQKARHLGPLLHADEVWCQLFSEPAAGSDLAGIHTRARQGDGRPLVAHRSEGVDDQRPVRLLRAAAGPHRPRRAQAQGADHVHRPDGRAGGQRAPAAADLRRGGVQRGVPRRGHARGRRGRRRRRQRLGDGAHRAHVRAADDRLRLGVVRLARVAGGPDRRRRRRIAPIRRSGTASAR